MSWRDGRDSCTCSCTLTGLPAQIPTELRRGSANKTQTVILEVPTCLTPHILTSSPRPTNSNNYNLLLLTTITYYYLLLTTNYQHSYRNLLKYIPPFFNSPPPPHYYIILLYNYYIHSYCYTTLCCMFSPRLGVLGRYIYILYNIYSTYIYMRLYILIIIIIIFIYMHTHILRSYIHIYM